MKRLRWLIVVSALALIAASLPASFEVKGRNDAGRFPAKIAPDSASGPIAADEAAQTQPRVFVAVNQVGYLPGEPKWSVLATEKALGDTPDWTLKNATSGEAVASGQTRAGSLDSASGDYVYVADFSEVKTPGSYVLSIAEWNSPPFQIGSDLYSALKRDAVRYFYLTRSGIPLEEKYAGKTWARPAGHISDNDVTCFKGRDINGKTWDGCAYRLDASGGWYDAGDFGKYVVNGGISTWTLLDWYEHSPKSFPDGSLNIPESGNGVPDILDEARWEMEFMLKMQVPAGQPLAGMAHHKLHNLQWPPMPAPLPEKINNDDPVNGRYLMPPSTAATLNLAATAAQCARIWKTIDAPFADRCLKAAQTAWQAALANPKMFYGNIPGNGGGDYGDNNVDDEFYWAAAELYITTGEAAYHDYLSGSSYFANFPGLRPGSASSMYWGGTAALGTISLVTVSNGLPKADIDRMREQIVQTADKYLKVIKGEGYGVPLTGNDYVWGSNSDVLNNALIMALAYDFTQSAAYLNGVAESMNYILGRNANNQSFVSGYGTTTLTHPHHRVWGNVPSLGYPPPPPGVIAGGPNGQPADPIAISRVKDLPPARRYLDDIDSYSTNEVTINWNAPLVWVSAYLDEQARK